MDLEFASNESPSVRFENLVGLEKISYSIQLKKYPAPERQDILLKAEIELFTKVKTLSTGYKILIFTPPLITNPSTGA
ncbi:hypothetical protein GCM10009119_11140 [Algoriphagus jejuensis]|uniref:Uncharacterized protein n=1 Tax=Algoriphagus jejuensis TaxID=419934 RepID=A0ABN1MYG0_9BACT